MVSLNWSLHVLLPVYTIFINFKVNAIYPFLIIAIVKKKINSIFVENVLNYVWIVLLLTQIHVPNVVQKHFYMELHVIMIVQKQLH